MADTHRKPKAEIPTIDCCLVTVVIPDGDDELEIGFDTSNKVAVETQIEEEDAVKLVVKGILRAQKPKVATITGTKITLTDNVFNPELVQILQGGTITYSSGTPQQVTGYTPPVAGSSDKGQVFELNVYSAVYNAAGVITKYEKTTYPNCQGEPVAFNSEDGVFRAPEYTINSAPNTGEAPYTISYVSDLPELS